MRQGYSGGRRDSLNVVDPLPAPTTANSSRQARCKNRSEGASFTTQHRFPDWVRIDCGPELRKPGRLHLHPGTMLCQEERRRWGVQSGR